MNSNFIFFFTALVCTIAYVGGTTLKFGVLNSISQTFYALGKYRILFPTWTSITALCIMIACDSTPTTIAGTGLIIVGTAPYFYDKIQKYIHYLGAIATVVGSIWYWNSTFVSCEFVLLRACMTIPFIMLIIFYINIKPRTWLYQIELLVLIYFFIFGGITLYYG